MPVLLTPPLVLAYQPQAAEQQQQQQQTASPSTNVKLSGPEPKRFAVAEGELGRVGSAALAGVFRAGSGGFCFGYRSSLVDDDGK